MAEDYGGSGAEVIRTDSTILNAGSSWQKSSNYDRFQYTTLSSTTVNELGAPSQRACIAMNFVTASALSAEQGSPVLAES